MSEHLLVSKEERVLRLTLNRPEKKNALNSELCVALVNALRTAGEDHDVGCVLLDARGDVFCAGMDLDEVLSSEGQASAEIHGALFTAATWMTKPLVACLNGPALGGGVGLVANAHIAVAPHGCTFGLTEIRIGMWPFVIWRAVTRSLGERRALSLALTGRIFGANEALQWGLLHEVAPAFEVDERASATAFHLSGLSPNTIRTGLRFAAESAVMDSETAAALALETRAEVFRSEDFAEGVAALREKRKPVWAR